MRFLAFALLAVLGVTGPALSRAPAAAPAVDWTKTVVRTPEGGVRMGNPAAPVKLIEYGARSCPTCARFAAESHDLRTKYVASGKVSFEYRDYLVHPQDLGAVVIGQCVSDRNFFAVLDSMFANQNRFNRKAESLGQARVDEIGALPPLARAQAWADEVGYTDLVRQAGMPEARIKACFANPQAIPTLARQLDGASKLGVQGTPSFFINGTRANAALWSQLEPLLKAAGG
jgi:protein-disulfide isomerase